MDKNFKMLIELLGMAFFFIAFIGYIWEMLRGVSI